MLKNTQTPSGGLGSDLFGPVFYCSLCAYPGLSVCLFLCRRITHASPEQWGGHFRSLVRISAIFTIWAQGPPTLLVRPVGSQVLLHCPKSNPKFRDITRNVDDNEILRVLSNFPRFISCSISENRLITFGTVQLGKTAIKPTIFRETYNPFRGPYDPFLATIRPDYSTIVQLNSFPPWGPLFHFPPDSACSGALITENIAC